MTNPWDVLPIASKGDNDENKIFIAVGMALTCWERLEYSRATIFAALVSSRSGAAERAFGTISSSAGRADMILAAAKPILSGNVVLAKKLTSLMTEIEKLAGRRNDIAHGVVTHFTTTDNGGEPKEHGAYLVPAYYNTRKMLDAAEALMRDHHFMILSKYAYTAEQVRTYAGHFNACRVRSSELHLEIWDYCKQKFPPQLPPGLTG